MIYSKFREVKAYHTKKYKGIPEANDRKKWYYDTLRFLNINSVKSNEVSAYYWKVIYENMQPYIDFMYALPYFIENFRLFILTDELNEICKRKIKSLGLNKIFENTISSEQVGATKPNKKLFSYALDLVGEFPGSVLVVGDNPSTDIVGGNAVGMHTAWLRRGKYYYYQYDNISEPDIVFYNYIQLMSKLADL